ncbi:thiosulfate sulfurtransferase 16, chloroplastic-like [Curcuma longa]|uniref:thiosulfate sulfurtransferase 16, chloroplastic-like n=1 Tax=Curcuma longa TaxID=136217 RepID=UPI003D9EA5E8
MVSRVTDSILFLALLLLSLLPALSSEAAVPVTIDVHAANGLLVSGSKYLDVRTVEEFNKGHPMGALNVPYMFFTPQGREQNPKFLERVSLVCDKDDHIVVGCRSGVRSLYATEDLLKAGFKDVKNMGGGYIAWVENGFQVKELKEEL